MTQRIRLIKTKILGAIFGIILAPACSNKSMHHLFEFGKEKDVYLQLDLDLSIPGFSDQIADSPGEEYALSAYLIRQGQDELLVNMRFKGGTSGNSIPVVINALQQSVNTILEIPLTESVDPTLGTYIFRFRLSPASAASGLRLDDDSEPLNFETIETKIQRGDNLAAINYRSTIVTKIVDASGVSSVTEALTADKLAATLEGIDVKVKEKISTLTAPVVSETVNSHFTAGRITDVLTPVLRYLQYSVATDTSLQDALTPVITEKSGIATSDVVSRYASNFINTAVTDMTQVVNNSNYSSMKEVITTKYISEAAIPSSTETLTTTWTPRGLNFTDTLRTSKISGTIAITNPTNTTGLYAFAIYAGGSTAANGKSQYLGLAPIGNASTTLSLSEITLATSETTFWVYPVVDTADTSTPHGKKELNSPYSKTIVNLVVQCVAGQYLVNGSCVAVGTGYWSDGTTDLRTACSNASYATYTDANATSASCAFTCNATFSKVNNSCVCPAGKYAVSGSCSNVSNGYWSNGTGTTQTACSNKPNYSTYNSGTNSSSSCAFTCNASFSLSAGSCVCPSGYLVVGSVCNGPPVALSTQSGVGYAYQSSQLGGLSFTRYGHNSPSGNQVSHNEMMDFLDDPVGNADGVRADGTVAQRTYYFSGTSTPGWIQSASNNKYSDVNGHITPVPGGDYFGDTYRGYFVPPLDGIYRFSNEVIPDNGVRILMSPNECPNNAIAVISSDLVGSANVGGTTRTSGAVDAQSIWIAGNGGAFRTAAVGSFQNQPNNEYVHNTQVFFPLAGSDPDYANGDVYLLANRIYYLEIRYSEGGGGNDFSFGYDRKNIGGTSWDGVQFLDASDMLPYAGSDKYVPRQACAGAYDATSFFSDPDGDTLTYSARLVTSAGAAIPGTAGLVTSIGLSFNTSTGQLSGTLNSSYTSQKVIFSAKDSAGTNTWVDSTALKFIANATCAAGKYFTDTGYCSNVGLGYWSDGTNNARSTCSNTPPTHAHFDSYASTTATCSWACDTGYTLSNSQCI